RARAVPRPPVHARPRPRARRRRLRAAVAAGGAGRVKALIVDDEAPARAKLVRLLADDGRFELAGEADDGVAAVAQIEALQPDLLLLDVQMPGLNGFEVLRAVGAAACPKVIFSTAHDRYAVEAFDAHAVDYLLKPYDAERFRVALDKACAQLR